MAKSRMEIGSKSSWKCKQKTAGPGNRIGETMLKFVLKSNETYAWIRSQGEYSGQSEAFGSKCFNRQAAMVSF